jgi:DNA-3-methyladenine glycosylase I
MADVDVLPRPTVITGSDGRARCAWAAGDADYRTYHDEDWGVPLHGDTALFEALSLEAFQSGLSWITILGRRSTFRAAFSDFDLDTVAGLDEQAVERLLLDPGIIRNRAKIVATVSNARITQQLVAADPGALDRLVWGFAPTEERPRPTRWEEIRAVSAESTALSAALRTLGYRFVGPTTMHALLQAAGLIDDHFVGCWRA